VEDALRAVTIESAYSWRKENEPGSIAPGKIANFTVLEQESLAVLASTIRQTVCHVNHFSRLILKIFPLDTQSPG